jgi:hypothetical protein
MTEPSTTWVEEAARRRYPAAGPSSTQILPPATRRKRLFGVMREIYLFAALAAAAANFYFMQVMVQINSMPSLIVFVPLDVRTG